MRADMAKVIVERPRIGHGDSHKGKGYRRRFQRLAADELPRREGIKRRSGGTKSFNEHLGPLRRFLDARVGRKWDDVYSELSERIDRSSVVQNHFWTHVNQYVERNVVLRDGVPCGLPGCGRYRECPLGPGQWYVCPATGRLKKTAQKARRRNWRNPPPPDPYASGIRLSDTLQCRRVKGTWSLVELRPLPPAQRCFAQRDVVLNEDLRVIDETRARATYGASVYAVAVQPLTRRELSQYPIPRELW